MYFHLLFRNFQLVQKIRSIHGRRSIVVLLKKKRKAFGGYAGNGQEYYISSTPLPDWHTWKHCIPTIKLNIEKHPAPLSHPARDTIHQADYECFGAVEKNHRNISNTRHSQQEATDAQNVTGDLFSPVKRPSMVTSSPTRPAKGPLIPRTSSPRANGVLFM